MRTSMTQAAPVAHPLREVAPQPEVFGADRLRGRSRQELAEAMTWLAWYAPGTFTAVLDYMDTVNGEPLPDRA
jgi:hypothetical protein